MPSKVCTRGQGFEPAQHFHRHEHECVYVSLTYYRDMTLHQILADRLGLYMQAYTLYSSVRPFGVTAILGCDDAKSSSGGPGLYMIEPNGVYWGYRGCATGKGRQLAKTEIEKLDLDNMTCEEALKHAALIIHTVHDEVKDKEFELEMSWIRAGQRCEPVPKDLLSQAEAWAKQQLESEMEE